MSAEATGWVFRYSPLTSVAFAVHLAIADSVNDQNENEFWMNQAALAAKARTSRKTVNAALAQLVADGFLEPVRMTLGQANRYRFMMPTGLDDRLARARKGVTTGDTSAPRGVSPLVTPPVTTGDRGVSPVVTHNPKETQKNPTQAKAARAAREPAFSDAADRLARDRWEKRAQKPVCGFPALRQRIQEALDSGYSETELASVLPAMFVFSRNSFDVALGSKRAGPIARPTARPVDDDRGAPSGRVAL